MDIVGIELAKCREHTKDEAVVLLMMQAKVDVLDEVTERTCTGCGINSIDLCCDDCRCTGSEINAHATSRDQLKTWCLTQKVHDRERRESLEPVVAR